MPYRTGCLALLALALGCDRTAVEPCSDGEPLPILQIASVRNEATGATVPAVLFTDLQLDGAPLTTYPGRMIERTREGLVCTVPCAFGAEPGTYTFTMNAATFYRKQAEVVAAPVPDPAGCPGPTRAELTLVEADSARVSFHFETRPGTGLTAADALAIYNDGSGDRSIHLTARSVEFDTRNTGTLRVQVVVGAPDTIAVGEVELPLRKDWRWSVGVWVYDRNPGELGFCVPTAVSFPLRRSVPGADSLYINWTGLPISRIAVC